MPEEKNKTMHSIRYNFTMNIILTASRFIYPLIVFPYVARILNAEGIGTVSFAQSVVNYFYMIAALGIPSYGIRACSRARNNKTELSKVSQELLIMNLITMILSYFCFSIMIVCMQTTNTGLLIMLVCGMNILFQTIGVPWFYQGVEEYGFITYRTIFTKCISALFIFFMVRKPEDAIWYATGSVLAEAGAAVSNLLHLRKFIYFKPVRNLNLKKHMKPILIFFASSVAISVYSSLDAVMLGVLSTADEVGFYAAGLKISRFLSYIATSLGAVTFPRISNYLQHGKEKEGNALVSKSVHFSFIATIPLVTFFFVFSEHIMLVYAGKGYAPAGIVLKMTSLILLFSTLSNALTNQVLLPRGYEKYVTISVGAGAFMDLIFNFLLIPKYGAAGAALATVVTELTVMLIELYFSRRFLNIVFAEVDILRTVVLFMSVLMVFYMCKNSFTQFNVLSLSAIFGFTCTAYLMVLMILGDSLIIEVIHLIRKRL